MSAHPPGFDFICEACAALTREPLPPEMVPLNGIDDGGDPERASVGRVFCSRSGMWERVFPAWCERRPLGCTNRVAYPGARYCGAACSTEAEAGR